MNLYLVSQYVNNCYDTYDAFVCAAETEQIAATIHPFFKNKLDNSDRTWVDDIGDVEVAKIGTAKPGTIEGVILASFNAG